MIRAVADFATNIVSIPVDLSLDSHGIAQVNATRARVRGQLKSGVSRQMYIDPTGTGLQFPLRGLLAVNSNSSAPCMHAEAATQTSCINGSAACGCFELTLNIVQRDAARTRRGGRQ